MSRNVVLRIGKAKPVYEYKMLSQGMQEVDVERDLGVLVSSDLKVSVQCTNACSKANKMLGMINRCIGNKSSDVMVRL